MWHEFFLGVVHLAVQGCVFVIVWVFGWNPKVWSFKWMLQIRTFWDILLSRVFLNFESVVMWGIEWVISCKVIQCSFPGQVQLCNVTLMVKPTVHSNRFRSHFKTYKSAFPFTFRQGTIVKEFRDRNISMTISIHNCLTFEKVTLSHFVSVVHIPLKVTLPCVMSRLSACSATQLITLVPFVEPARSQSWNPVVVTFVVQ